MASVMTKLADLINPEVIGASINAKLVNLIKFSPFATIGRELQGQAGNTLTIPAWSYIGDAVDKAEGEAFETVGLSATTTTVTVKKAGNAVEITDEAVLSAYGDPIGEATNQLAMSIAQKIDNDCLAALGTIGVSMTHDKGDSQSGSIIGFDVIADALVKFGEEVDDPTYLVIAPAQLAQLRKDNDFQYINQGQTLVTGQVGTLHGVGVVVSNKIVAANSKYTNFLIRAGALGIEMKRDVAVETDRDILKKTNVISADVHYIAYLRDASKAVKLIVKQS